MFNKLTLISFVVCALCVTSSSAFSPWFTASFNDVKETLRRYSYCTKFLEPIKMATANGSSSSYEQTDYLIKQMKTFFDIADYRAEQVTNLTTLFDQICNETSDDFAVAEGVPTFAFNHSKVLRCKVVDDALDRMYPILKLASYNKSERIDFSPIVFTSLNGTVVKEYNLTDLIITSWITAGAPQNQICRISNQLRAHLNKRTTERRDSTNFNDSAAAQRYRVVNNFYYIVDTLLDRFLSLQRRAYWDGTTSLQQAYVALVQGLSASTNFVSDGVRGIRGRLPFVGNYTNNITNTHAASHRTNFSSSVLNGTRPQHLNASPTVDAKAVNSTMLPSMTPEASFVNSTQQL